MKNDGVHLFCKGIKKTLQISAYLLALSLMLLTGIYGIFRTSVVQSWIAGRAAAYLSEQMGTTVSIGGLDISWFMDIVVEDLIVKDKSGRDLLNTERLKADIGKFSRKQNYIGIYAISLKNAKINLVVNKADSLMNYDFILDYFAGTDTTTSKKTSPPWKIGISGIGLKNCEFNYNNELKSGTFHGVDYDHLSIRNLNLDVRKLSVVADSITASIRSLSLREQSGFVLDDFSAQVCIRPTEIRASALKIITPHSKLDFNLVFEHSGYQAYNDFIDSVRMTGDFNPSELNLKDITYFAPEIEGMNNEISFKGLVKGTVSSLKARAFSFQTGKNTSFEGNISMDGLPDIMETFIHLKVKSLTTDYNDLSTFLLPGGQTLGLPAEINRLGIISIKGHFTGFYNDFVSAATFRTGVGTLVTDLSLKMSKSKTIDYNGHLELKNWQIDKTFPEAGDFGLLDFTSSLSGSITDYRDFSATMSANVNRLGMYGNEFRNIKIDGGISNRQFNGMLTLNDKLINLNFKGMVDFSDSLPRMNFTSTVNNAYLSKLHLWERDSSSCLSTKMNLNFTGTNIDNLLGTISFDSTYYKETTFSYHLDEFALQTRIDPFGKKSLNLKSDFLNARFQGKFTFADLYNSATNIISTYIPSLQLDAYSNKKIHKEQLFEYDISIKNTEAITAIFLPEFKLVGEANLFGSYNSATETVLLNGGAKRIYYQGVLFENWFIRGQNTGKLLQINTGSSSVVWKEPEPDDPLRMGIDNLDLLTVMQGDSIRYRINWLNTDTITINSGNISGSVLFNRAPQILVGLDTVALVINNQAWSITQKDDLIIDSTAVSVNELTVSGKGQQLRCTGRISENSHDVLNLWLDHFDISNSDLAFDRYDIDFDGNVNGKISLSDLYGERTIQSDIGIEKFAFNGEHLGDAKILSWWDNEIEGIGVDASIIYHGNVSTHNPVMVKGTIYPSSDKKRNFDLGITLLNYKLASLNPFLEGFASNLKGMASGQMTLTGTFDDPALNGQVQLMRTQMKIDYLNVTYSLADQVLVTPKVISASNVMVYDSLGNTGLLDFRLFHNYFRDMVLDMSVNFNNLAGMNTTIRHNDMFYGSAFGTGKVTIKGPFSDLRMDITARSEKNTNIYIPINLATDASENEYIRFVNKNQDIIQEETFEANTSGVNLDMLLDVTKDANIQIFLPENIGNIKGNGNGQIRMGIDTRGDITMFGDYRMNEGTFLFTFKNLLNRVFTIENGSVISFRGSPYEADIALRAVYKLRASLKSIPEIADMPEYAGKSVPVNCVISLKNNLYNPDISFSFQLPEADQVLRQHIYAAIDTTNEAVMTQQMVSLLLMKSFGFSTGNTNLASSVSSSSLEVLTNQLSNMLSQISKDVDIGLNYRAGDALSSEELELALSTHFFNDRVTIDGNLGVTTAGTTENTNNLVGDITVDVKITPDGRFRVKAFNKANNPFDISASYATYKQGIGVYYRYEFDRFSELFRRQKKKPEDVL